MAMGYKKGMNSLFNGYKVRQRHGHQRAMGTGQYVYEHILEAESAIGHQLPQKAEVHHFNEVKTDNQHENLVICEDRRYHLLLHTRAKAYRATGNANSRQCSFCHEWILSGEPDQRRYRYTSGSIRVSHVRCENAYVLRRYHAKKMERP